MRTVPLRGLDRGADEHGLSAVQITDTSWRAVSRCAETDPELFFPEKGRSAASALRVCAGCEVRRECLAYALDHKERFGVWGGMTERARRRLVKQRLRTAAAAVAGVPVPVEPAVPVAGAGEAA